MPTASLACAIWAASLVSAGAFDLQGHRGTRGLAPENTLAAFRIAVALGVTTLETDLAVTKDDVGTADIEWTEEGADDECRDDIAADDADEVVDDR